MDGRRSTRITGALLVLTALVLMVSAAVFAGKLGGPLPVIVIPIAWIAGGFTLLQGARRLLSRQDIGTVPPDELRDFVEDPHSRQGRHS